MRVKTAAILVLAAMALSACADLPLGKMRDPRVAPPGPRPMPGEPTR
jgi:hypothetical protein